ncbi:MAG: hypothetical protein ACQERD_03555 [Campylobacterota bacterium]
MNFIANTYDFESILLTPTENIENKALKSYIFTSLQLKNINIENKKIFYTHLYKTNTYQVFITDMKFDIFVFELLNKTLKNDSKSTKLFICDEFFALFENSTLYYYKRLNHEINIDDIKGFVQKKLKVEEFDIEYISEEKINELTNSFLNKKTKPKSKLKAIYRTNRAIYLYFIYIVLLFSLFGGYFFYEKSRLQAQNQKNQEIYLSNIKKAKEDISFFPVTKQLDDFFKKLEKNSIKIQRLSYENRLLRFVLYSKSSKNINSFILNNKDSIKVNRIENDLENGYKVDGFIRFFK